MIQTNYFILSVELLEAIAEKIFGESYNQSKHKLIKEITMYLDKTIVTITLYKVDKHSWFEESKKHKGIIYKNKEEILRYTFGDQPDIRIQNSIPVFVYKGTEGYHEYIETVIN